MRILRYKLVLRCDLWEGIRSRRKHHESSLLKWTSNFKYGETIDFVRGFVPSTYMTDKILMHGTLSSLLLSGNPTSAPKTRYRKNKAILTTEVCYS
jgi:hypothetical protein